MEAQGKRNFRNLLIRLAATLDRIKQSDLSLETQLWVNECTQMCDQMLAQLYSLGSEAESTPPVRPPGTPGMPPPLRKLQPLAPPEGTSEGTEVAPEPGEFEADPDDSAAITQIIQPKTVMVIDDDEDTLRLLNFLLTKKGGFSVLCKSNPVEALETLKTKTPDVILMDLMMPQMNGFEVLRRIKQEKDWEDIKILIGSSRTYDKDKLAVLQGGANDFIAKPYNLEELVLRLRNLLR